jgi:hypothetical protein
MRFRSLRFVNGANQNQIPHVADRVTPLIATQHGQRFVAHHPQQISPRTLGRRQQRRFAGQSHHGRLDGILGVVLLSRNRRGKPNQPPGRQVKQRSQRIDAVGGKSIRSLPNSASKVVWLSHVTSYDARRLGFCLKFCRKTLRLAQLWVSGDEGPFDHAAEIGRSLFQARENAAAFLQPVDQLFKDDTALKPSDYRSVSGSRSLLVKKF